MNRDSKRSGERHGIIEKFPAAFGNDMAENGLTPGAAAGDGDSVRVSAEGRDVLPHPLHRQTLVEQTPVRLVLLFYFFQVPKTEGRESII